MTTKERFPMRKTLTLTFGLVIVGVLTAACGAPPPLQSNTYLKDTSLIATAAADSANPCTAPCFHGITPGQTTYTDAIALIKKDAAFSNVQSQDTAKPPQASWSTAGGEACCQMTADDKGVVNALIAKVTPDMTLQQVIDKYGQPKYVFPVDYSDTEVAIATIYPDQGLVVWVSPGNANSKVAPDSKVVMVLFLDPKTWNDQLSMATLKGWNGFTDYSAYQTETPIVTPAITPTPGG